MESLIKLTQGLCPYAAYPGMQFWLSGIGTINVSWTRQMKILFRWTFCANGGRVSCPRQVLLDLTARSRASYSVPACPAFQCFGLKKSSCLQPKATSIMLPKPRIVKGTFSSSVYHSPNWSKSKGPLEKTASMYVFVCPLMQLHVKVVYIKLIPRAQHNKSISLSSGSLNTATAEWHREKTTVSARWSKISKNYEMWPFML